MGGFIVGLDQSFYVKQGDQTKEVLYFRKFWNLQDYIGEMFNETILNFKIYRLEPDDLNRIADYLVFNYDKYWAFADDFDTADIPDTVFETIGKLKYYAVKNIPLYYRGDW